ncbi:MAG: hypothetical protein IPM69_07185 [Ignavibacteria bacterium]|nr:hypothetical protein [Ignavibacteria bacterium]
MFITSSFASIVLIFCTVCVFAQGTNTSPVEYEDIIVLKSGVSFSGIIFEQVPNKIYKIRLHDGTILEFEAYLVEIISRQPRVILPPLQQKEKTSTPTPPSTISQVSTIYPNADKAIPLKPLWFTIGPNINAGYSTSLSFSNYSNMNLGSGYMYGFGGSVSCGFKVGEKSYVWGSVSGDMGRMASVSVDQSYIVNSNINEYRIGVGMSNKVQNYFMIWSLGYSFGERWDDEVSDIYGKIRPQGYFTDRFASITWGVVMPIDKRIAGSVSTNINGLFETLNIALKLGLVYTPNLENL